MARMPWIRLVTFSMVLLVGASVLPQVQAAPTERRRRPSAGGRGGGLPFPRAQLPQDRRAVEENPDDPALAVRLAVDLVRANQPAEAIPYFRFAEGTGALENNLSFYADALRDAGRGREAAALRRGQGVQPTLASALAVVADLQAAGDLLAALDAVEEAEAGFPRAAVVFDYEADVRLDAGDQAGAEVALALAWHLGDSNPRRVRTEARLLALGGDREAAVAMLEPRLRGRSAKEDDVRLLGSLLLVSGEGARVVELVDRPRWRGYQTPTIQGLLVQALVVSGRTDEALALCRTVRATFGEHRYALDAETTVRAALGRGCAE